MPLTNEAAVHRLVDDVLAYIFFLNANVPDPDGHATTVASSQVCMRWRSIALQCHTIWGLIIDYSQHSLKCIETLLDRSHPSSLDFGSRVDAVYLANNGQDVLELVFNHVDRLRTFNLQVPLSSWKLVCSRFLQLPAPNLEFVNIFIIIGDIRQIRTPHPLFDHYAPNLQNLQLRRCTVDFTSPILTRLTELYVSGIAHSSAVPTILDWFNILGGMPSLRWVTLIRAISSVMTNDIYPIIPLAALEMLSVKDGFQESVTFVEHLIIPPRCGLRLSCDDAHEGFDQRKIWSIVKKRMGSWTKNASNRYLEVLSSQGGTFIFGNLHHEIEWSTEAEDKHLIHLVDPVVAITLHFSNPQDIFPLLSTLFALFEWTFFDTTNLKLCIDYGPDSGLEAFLPLVDMFRGFVNLKDMYLGYNSLLHYFLPLLQRPLPNSALLPKLQTLRLCNAMLWPTSLSLLRVADFLRWRGEQGFPVQKVHIVDSWINGQSKHMLTRIQNTVIEIDGSNHSDSEWDDDTSEHEEGDWYF